MVLGDDDGLNCAIYFEGSDIDRDRFQSLTLTCTTQQELKKMTTRGEWVFHLKEHTKTYVEWNLMILMTSYSGQSTKY